MSNIGGKKREQQELKEYVKKVGLFEAKVIAINPTAEECKDILGFEPKEDSKSLQYLGKTENGETKLTIDVWLEEVVSKDRFKLKFYLEDIVKFNRTGTKKQYIDSIGKCSYAVDANDLPDWYTKRDYRVAFVGEEDLYKFLRTWLGNLDYRDAETTLSLDWKKLMKGNVKDLKDQINGEWCTNIVALATVKTSMKDGEKVEYQNVYSKGFLPAYSLRQFRNMDFSDPEVLKTLRDKKENNSKELKTHERFVLEVTGEYGCRDHYTFKPLMVYNPKDNVVASDDVMIDDDFNF